MRRLMPLLFVLLALGCGGGDSLVKVKGRLTKADAPMTVGPKGKVVLVFWRLRPDGVAGDKYRTDLRPDGTFDVLPEEGKTGIPAGKYRITVGWMDPGPGNDKLKGVFNPVTSPLVRDLVGP